MRLITIRFSHFNERARWALDRLGVAYEEEPYMPFFHVLAVARATGGRGGAADRHSSRYSTPVLITDSGRILTDSREIVRWASDTFGSEAMNLYPEPWRAEIEAFERDVEQRLGPHTRRVAYYIAFADPAVTMALATRNVSERQARAFRIVAPLVVTMIRRRLRVDKHAASLDVVRRFVAELEPRLAGRQYVIGDRFTAADLTLAALFAPLLLPTPAEGYGAALPAISELPASGAALVQEMRSHAVGRFCLRLFATERGVRQIPCVP
jgi:glutathione S-transferase